MFFIVFFETLNYHSLVNSRSLMYATLRMRPSLECLRLYCLRLDGAYRRELKRAMLKMVLSLLQPSKICLSAFLYSCRYLFPAAFFQPCQAQPLQPVASYGLQSYFSCQQSAGH